MYRKTWLAERRAAVEASYTEDAPGYDDEYDPATPVHRRFVDRLVDLCPPGGAVLDVPCGTGPYFGIVLAAGRTVVGADQSAGMLEAARAKHPDVRLEHVGLQELAFDAVFDGVMTVDSMEHVPPEEWPMVVANLRRALRPGGHLYVTIEETDPTEIDRAFTDARAHGLPAVHGELTTGDTGGYHYYPGRDRARAWLRDAGFEIVDEADEPLDGYAYWHILAQSAGPPS